MEKGQFTVGVYGAEVCRSRLRIVKLKFDYEDNFIQLVSNIS